MMPNKLESESIQDWLTSTLGKICESITDGTHFTPQYVEQGIPFYSVENVTSNDFVNTKFISESEHSNLIKRCKPEKGDILMTRIGSIGDTKLIDWDVDASIYVSLALLKLKNEIDPGYFYQYSKSDFFKIDVYKKSLLNAIPMKINMDAISNVEIRHPRSTKEQEAIAKVLFDIDSLIDALSKLISKSIDIFAGALVQSFNQDAESAPIKVNQICLIEKGTATEYDKDFIEGDFGFLNGGVSFSGSTRDFNDSGNTVVVSEGGNSCGYVNYFAKPFWCGGHAYRLTNFQGNQKYLYYAMKNCESQIMNLRVGSGLPNIQKKDLGVFEIQFHKDEKRQESVVLFLDSLSVELDSLKVELFKYELLRQGMMNDLLTGKIRVV